jgi:hypothetical protein
MQLARTSRRHPTVALGIGLALGAGAAWLVRRAGEERR